LLAHALWNLAIGRDEDYLREALRTAELQGLPDVVVSLRLAENRFHAGGRQAVLAELSAGETRGERGTDAAVKIARYRALAGDRTGTLHWLRTALEQHDHDVVRAAA
jgi:hypothetical protein